MRTIGILHSGTKNNNDQKAQIDAFIKSLGSLGYNTTGANANLTIVGPLFEDDDPGTLDTNADALATTANLDVLVAAGGTRSFVAAQNARMKAGKPNLTIVFTSVSTPPAADAYLTGVGALTSELDGERLALLHELIGKPANSSLGILRNPTRPNAAKEVGDLIKAAATLKMTPVVLVNVDYSKQIKKEINDAFQNTFKGNVSAVLVAADPLFNDHRKDVVAAANATPIPAVYQWREFADDGGLMSFGTKLTQSYKMAAGYVAVILKGKDNNKNPEILPVLSPHVELVINTKPAKNLVDIPPLLFARADDVIDK